MGWGDYNVTCSLCGKVLRRYDLEEHAVPCSAKHTVPPLDGESFDEWMARDKAEKAKKLAP